MPLPFASMACNTAFAINSGSMPEAKVGLYFALSSSLFVFSINAVSTDPGFIVVIAKQSANSIFKDSLMAKTACFVAQ